MINLDKTYCDKTSCKNYKCDRNQIHVYNESKRYEIWIGEFPNCKKYLNGVRDMSDLSEKEIIDIIKGLSIDEYEWYLENEKYEGNNEDIAFIVSNAINKLLDLYKQLQDKCIELTTTIDALQTDLKEEKEKNKNLIDGIKELSKEIDDACSDDGWWYVDRLNKLLEE